MNTIAGYPVQTYLEVKMIDEDLLKEATEYMLKDTRHKEEYENAPSKACREYLELLYYHSYHCIEIAHNEEMRQEFLSEREKIRREDAVRGLGAFARICST